MATLRRSIAGLTLSLGAPGDVPEDHPPPRWLAYEALWLRSAVPLGLAAFAVQRMWAPGTSWVAWAVVPVVLVVLGWRRSAPLLAFVGCATGALSLTGTRGALVAALAVEVAIYSVAVRRTLAVGVLSAAAFELGLALVALHGLSGGIDGADIVGLSGLTVASLLLGTTLRANRRYLASVAERARRLEHEREQQERLVAAAERTRIAREMHDIVAHGLSVVITLSQGAATSAVTDPAQAQQAMGQVADAARESLSEMRKLLDVLRDDETVDRQPQPSLATLERVLDDTRATGLSVALQRTGDADVLGPAAQATVLRIVQESLTNVIKHAHDASAVTVELEFTPDAVHFLIQDDGGVGSDPAAEAARPGRGLAGIRERVAIFGGSVDARRAADGWRVSGEMKVG